MKPTLFLSALVLLAVVGCTTRAEDATRLPAGPAPVAVRLAPVVPETEAIPIRSSGVVAASEEIKLSFKTGGLIAAVYAAEGALVQQGQLLARLDPAELEAGVAQAEAAVAKARRDLVRVEQLYADTVATLEQVQNLRTALTVAEAQLEALRFNRAHSEIYAPARGRILKRFAERGEMIGPGVPVYFLASAQGAQVLRVGLPDVEVVRVRPGDQAEVSFAAWPGETFAAQVSEIAAAADPRTGTYAVELRLDPHARPLKDGFIGKAVLHPAPAGARVRIPMAALVEAGREGLTVYVPEGDLAQPLHIADYQIGDDYLSVPAASLGGHAQVITAGAAYLRPGATIQVVPETEGKLSQGENRP